MAERTAGTAAKKAAPPKAAGKAVVKQGSGKAAAKPRIAAAPAVKKATVPVAARKAPAQKTAATRTKASARKSMGQPTPEERYRMVQTAAYFIAERDGFCGCPTEYWAAAEIEIASRLGA